MIDLPAGWVWTTIGEVGEVMLGRQRSPKWHTGAHMRPYLRVANVFEDRIDLSHVMEMDFPPDQFERFKLEPGDILLNEGQSPEWVGRPAMYRGELPGACFTNSLIRFRPLPGVDGRYALYLFRHHLRSRRFMREARITTNIAHLSSKRFVSVEFPLPPEAEQIRIVAALEEHLSRLEAAESAARSARGRLALLWDAALQEVFSASWRRVELDSLNDQNRPICYGILKPKTAQPGVVPYVEVRSISGGEIKVDQLHRTTQALHDAFPRSALRAGDVVMAVRGSFDRAAVVPVTLEGGNLSRDVARISPTGELLGEFLAAFLVSPEAQRFFRAHARGVAVQGVNIGDLRRLPVPIPDLDLQESAVAAIRRIGAANSRIRSEIETAEARAGRLRSAVLAAAFSGGLVHQDPDDEPASVLLKRMQRHRAVAASSTGLRKAEAS
jgi:restriction endonuclease S subunit